MALIGLAALGFTQTRAATDAASDADRARILATTATGTVHLVHELEREVAETAALGQRGGKAGLALVTAQRQRTDAAIVRYRENSQAAVRATPALLLAVRTADELLGRLQTTRAAVTASSATATAVTSDPIYRGLSESLLAVADALPAQIADIELANAARAVAAVASVEHFAALERDLLRALFVRKSLQPGDLVTLARLGGAREQREAEFNRVATAQEIAIYGATIRGNDVENANRMSAGARKADQDPAGLAIDGDAWYVAQSGTIRRINLVGLQLSDRLDGKAAEVAASAQRRAWATAIGTTSIGLAAFIIAIALAVRTARRLRRLRGAALTVARRDLPDAINSVITGSLPPSATESGPSAAAVTRSIAAINDEVGQVADAFATVHRTALRLAGEQAELRVDVARMAEVLARRIRTLITRQLRLLDEFERDETDPDVLARLFALDHIAARLRRNGENLLVLSGGEPGRPMSQAVPVSAVVTAAASEIEDFHRVEAAASDVAIAGPVVGDLVHLLAELLENAATFSPPNNPVRVDARRTVDGAIIRVHDSGIGIAPPRIGEINNRLARPAMLSSAAAGTMGLYVVAHLAARHGIRVQLHATGGGTVAYVSLPHRSLAQAGALTAGNRAAYADPVTVPSTVGPPLEGSAPPQPLSAQPATGGAMLGRPRPGLQQPLGQPAHHNNAPWFRPYLSGGGMQQQPPTPASTWGTPAPAAWPPPPPAPQPSMAPVSAVPASSVGGGPMSQQDLPRRRPGAQLAPSTNEPEAPAASVDPEIVRARLSAFAEGVSAALRRSNGVAPAQKDR